MKDPTYEKQLIEEKEEWKMAFIMSEVQNDNAPIGWGRYIPLAIAVLTFYDVKKKE